MVDTASDNTTAKASTTKAATPATDTYFVPEVGSVEAKSVEDALKKVNNANTKEKVGDGK